MSESAPRRFYKTADVVAAESGFSIALDSRTLRTPKGEAFIAPTHALAALCAREWAEQGEHIRPASMPLTQFAFAAIDHTPHRRDVIAALVASYIKTDLVCHRAAAPRELVERQASTWDPIVAWGRERFHMAIPVVTGVMPIDPSAWLTTTLEWEVDDLDHFRATALAQTVAVAGSALIGFALIEGRLTGDEAFAAAALDDLWSLERWGEDEEARARLDRQRAELENVARFMGALGEGV